MTTQRTKSQLMKTLDLQRVESSVDKVEGQTEKTLHTFLDNMDAIAYGVQAWFEENTGYPRRVTETTIDIAQVLGIPEDIIERWAAPRLTQLNRDTEKLNVIKSLLERL